MSSRWCLINRGCYRHELDQWLARHEAGPACRGGAGQQDGADRLGAAGPEGGFPACDTHRGVARADWRGECFSLGGMMMA